MKKYLLAFLVGFMMAQTAFAELQLVVTQGISAAFPIAVVPFAGQIPADNPANTLTGIIQADLSHSGYFDVMPTEKIQQFPDDIANVNFAYWKQSGTDYLVIGKVNDLGNDKYQVTFSLLNVVLGASDQRAAFQSPVIISKRYVIHKQQFRALAHRVSDAIYQQITGIRGVFSTKIAYVLVQRAPNQPTKYLLNVADADGYNPQALVISDAPLMSPAWSPDGGKIAYVSLADRQAAIYVVNVASGQQQLISRFPGINGAPSWSPDGGKLALVLSKSGTPDIYIYDLRNKKLQQITRGMAINTEPAWSPDGRSLLFTSNRGGGPQVYQYFFSDGKINRLTFDGNYNARPSFTPNGKAIVLLHQDRQGYNIAVQDLASGDMRVLTNNGYDSSPSVAPNGQMIIYANNATANGSLGIVSIDGKVQLSLPAQEGTVEEPAWSPFLN